MTPTPNMALVSQNIIKIIWIREIQIMNVKSLIREVIVEIYHLFQYTTLHSHL